MTGKRLLIGVFAIAVVAVGYFAATGWPPVGGGGEGAITKADRKVDSQIEAGDVQLTDADIQNLMQTDFFHKLVTDESFRKMVLDGSVQRAMALERHESLALGHELANRETQDLLRAGEFEKAAQGIAARTQISPSRLEVLLRNDFARQILLRSDVAEMRSVLETQRAALETGKYDVAARAVVDRFEVDANQMSVLLKNDFARQMLLRSDVETMRQVLTTQKAELETGKYDIAARAVVDRFAIDANQMSVLLKNDFARQMLLRNDVAEMRQVLTTQRAALETGKYDVAARAVVDRFAVDANQMSVLLKNDFARQMLLRSDVETMRQVLVTQKAELETGKYDIAARAVVDRFAVDANQMSLLLKNDFARQMLLRNDVAEMRQVLTTQRAALETGKYDIAARAVVDRFAVDANQMSVLLKNDFARQMLLRNDVAEMRQVLTTQRAALETGKYDIAARAVVDRFAVDANQMSVLLKNDFARQMLLRSDVETMRQVLTTQKAALETGKYDIAARAVVDRFAVDANQMSVLLKNDFARQMLLRNDVAEMRQVLTTQKAALETGKYDIAARAVVDRFAIDSNQMSVLLKNDFARQMLLRNDVAEMRQVLTTQKAALETGKYDIAARAVVDRFAIDSNQMSVLLKNDFARQMLLRNDVAEMRQVLVTQKAELETGKYDIAARAVVDRFAIDANQMSVLLKNDFARQMLLRNDVAEMRQVLTTQKFALETGKYDIAARAVVDRFAIDANQMSVLLKNDFAREVLLRSDVTTMRQVLTTQRASLETGKYDIAARAVVDRFTMDTGRLESFLSGPQMRAAVSDDNVAGMAAMLKADYFQSALSDQNFARVAISSSFKAELERGAFTGNRAAR